MTTKSVLVFQPDLAVAFTIDGQTAVELAQYAMGYYESMFQTMPVTYPDGKQAFLVDVLCNGYMECDLVTAWAGIPEVIKVDFDDFPATEKSKLDHSTFGDRHAVKLIMSKFQNLL